MASAVAQLFETAGLLENIFCQFATYDAEDYLPPGTVENLFILLRVNKTFNATIEGSIKLQRVMMLAHDDQSTHRYAGAAELIEYWSGKIAPEGPYLRSSADDDYWTVESTRVSGVFLITKTTCTSAQDSFHDDISWDFKSS